MFNELFFHGMSILFLLGSEMLLLIFALIFIINILKKNKAMHRLDEILSETTQLTKPK